MRQCTIYRILNQGTVINLSGVFSGKCLKASSVLVWKNIER